jgi:hypothetical protein
MPKNAIHWTVRCGALEVANAQNKFVFSVLVKVGVRPVSASVSQAKE